MIASPVDAWSYTEEFWEQDSDENLCIWEDKVGDTDNRIIINLYFTKFYYSVQIKRDKIGETSSQHDENEKFS
jgi:hypothetical protein